MSHLALPSEPSLRLVVLPRPGRNQDCDTTSPEPVSPVEPAAAPRPDPHSWIDRFVESVRMRTDAIGAAVALNVGGELRCCGTAGNAPPKGTVVSVGNTLVGECVRTGQVIRRDDLANRNMSVLLAPIHRGNGVIGVFALFWRPSIVISSANSDVARSATAMIAAILEAACGTADDHPEYLQLTENSEQASISKRLYGLPCDKCGSYYYSDEPRCPVCNASGAEERLTTAAKFAEPSHW